MTVNRRILLAARPDGLVTEDCLQRVEEPVPAIGDGRGRSSGCCSLSVDPTNRVWMREEDSYLPAIEHRRRRAGRRDRRGGREPARRLQRRATS